VEVITTIAAARATLDEVRARGETVGFVPTMGALHDGHGALVERAAAERDVVAVSVFVNPLQFGAGEDLERYPRPFERDVALAGRLGAGLVFAPGVDEMYPGPLVTTVSVGGPLGSVLEGAHRPGHLDGVATVVAKLFNVAGPSRMYFGEKDWQQLCVVRRLAADLSFPVEVIGVPTVREPDGLALSSRNVHLTPDQRAAAPRLSQALGAGRDSIAAGSRDPAHVEAIMAGRLEPFELDYAVVVDAATLTRVDPLRGELRLLVAARLGATRLIDNIGVVAP